jgi:DUF971 family protein
MKPKNIQRAGAGIQITWEDDHISDYSADYLRRRCPCAVCKENPERIKTGVLPLEILGNQKIDILSAQPIGWYALQFNFSDQHATGIYSHEFLREICPCEKCAQQKKL